MPGEYYFAWGAERSSQEDDAVRRHEESQRQAAEARRQQMAEQRAVAEARIQQRQSDDARRAQRQQQQADEARRRQQREAGARRKQDEETKVSIPVKGTPYIYIMEDNVRQYGIVYIRAPDGVIGAYSEKSYEKIKERVRMAQTEGEKEQFEFITIVEVMKQNPQIAKDIQDGNITVTELEPKQGQIVIENDKVILIPEESQKQPAAEVIKLISPEGTPHIYQSQGETRGRDDKVEKRRIFVAFFEICEDMSNAPEGWKRYPVGYILVIHGETLEECKKNIEELVRRGYIVRTKFVSIVEYLAQHPEAAESIKNKKIRVTELEPEQGEVVVTQTPEEEQKGTATVTTQPSYPWYLKPFYVFLEKLNLKGDDEWTGFAISV